MHTIKKTSTLQKILPLSLSLCVIGSASAGTMGDATTMPWWAGNLALTLGGYWGTQGEAQHVDINGIIGDDFTVNNRNDGSFLVGLGYYFKHTYPTPWPVKFGIQAFYLDTVNVAGVMVLENEFPNLSYNYHLRHYPLYAMAGTTVPVPVPNHPFALDIDVGIGPNFMDMTHFTVNSLDDGFTIPNSPFPRSHMTTEFSATVGVNVKLPTIMDKWPLSCGYRFFYLGEGNLPPISNQVLTSLETGSTYANALACTVTL